MEASHVSVLREAARRVASLGKGEDLAVVDASEAEPPTTGVRWQAAARGVWLEVPEPGCLDVCDALFARDASDLPLPTAGVQAVTYASDTAAFVGPVPTFVLGFWRNGKRFSWDARLLGQVVARMRSLLGEIQNEIVDFLAKSPTDRPAMATLVRQVLLGQDNSGEPIRAPHLAVVPLPSVLGPYPDGRIRRVALVGFGCAGDPTRRAIVDLAQVLLHGRELRDNRSGTGVLVLEETDDQWREMITNHSRTWVTVTPIVQDSKELTASEWKRLLQARGNAAQEPAKAAARELHFRKRRIELIERSVYRAISGQEARIESIEVARSGFIAGVQVATQYRVRGYLSETPRLHLRLVFDRPVVGPICVGRGRYVGFGLMWPTD
jgi:CRISPR-associated protein Csb2